MLMSTGLMDVLQPSVHSSVLQTYLIEEALQGQRYTFLGNFILSCWHMIYRLQSTTELEQKGLLKKSGAEEPAPWEYCKAWT
jgi:hypothetical protein